MNKPITLNLPEDVYNRASGLAQLIGRDLTEVLIEAISLSLSSTSSLNESDYAPRTGEANRHFSESVKSLSDREVMDSERTTDGIRTGSKVESTAFFAAGRYT